MKTLALAIVIAVTVLLNGCMTKQHRVYAIFCDGKVLAQNYAPDSNSKYRPYRKGDVMVYLDADNDQHNVTVRDCFLTVVETRWRE